MINSRAMPAPLSPTHGVSRHETPGQESNERLCRPPGASSNSAPTAGRLALCMETNTPVGDAGPSHGRCLVDDQVDLLRVLDRVPRDSDRFGVAQSAAKFFAGWISELRPQLEHVLTDDETEIVGRYDVYSRAGLGHHRLATSTETATRAVSSSGRGWLLYGSTCSCQSRSAVRSVVSGLTGELRRLIKHERAVGGSSTKRSRTEQLW